MLTHDIFKVHALRNPDGEAVICEDGGHQTWQEIERSISAVADMLASLGVRKGDRVCCLGKNCIEAVQIYSAPTRSAHFTHR